MAGMGKHWLLAIDSHARSKWFPFDPGLHRTQQNCSWLLLLPTAERLRQDQAGPCDEGADCQARGVVLKAHPGKQGEEARPWDSAAHATIHSPDANPATTSKAPGMSL